IRGDDTYFELARTVIANRDDRSDSAGSLPAMIPNAHYLAKADIRGESECSRRACLSVGCVDEADGRGSHLHILALLNETLCHNAGKRSADLRLVDLIRRLA